LSDFINLRSAECVCSYYGLRVCSQTNKLNKLNKQLLLKVILRKAITGQRWISMSYSSRRLQAAHLGPRTLTNLQNSKPMLFQIGL